MSKGLQRIYTMSCDCRNNLECWPLQRYSTVPQILNSGRSNEKSRNLILIWYQFFLNILFSNQKSFLRLIVKIYINVLPCKNKAWTIIIYQYFTIWWYLKLSDQMHIKCRMIVFVSSTDPPLLSFNHFFHLVTTETIVFTLMIYESIKMNNYGRSKLIDKLKNNTYSVHDRG